MADYNSVNKKLHDILRIAKNSKHSNENALAEAVANRKLESFKFIYQQEPRYPSKATVRKYVNFAVTIGALRIFEGQLKPFDDLNLTNQQGVLNYLYHQTLEYGEGNGVTLTILQRCYGGLIDVSIPIFFNTFCYVEDCPSDIPESNRTITNSETIANRHILQFDCDQTIREIQKACTPPPFA